MGAGTGAVTLIHHFGSAANRDTRLHFLAQDDGYRIRVEGGPLFIETVNPAPAR